LGIKEENDKVFAKERTVRRIFYYGSIGIENAS
jgi:hypothetical protein